MSLKKITVSLFLMKQSHHYHSLCKTNFNYKNRDQHLAEIKSNEYDVIIIGGGATGCGALLSSSYKNLKTCLIENGDFGCATSTKSTKLLHGGLRYWQSIFDPFSYSTKKQDLYLVQEGLEERNIVLRNANYISNEIGMVFPSSNYFRNSFNFIGILLYHYYGQFHNKSEFTLSTPKFLFPSDMKKIFPTLNKRMKFGVLFYDGQFEESRMIMDSILTATAIEDADLTKANVLNYAKVEDYTRDSEGKINGVKIHDKINNKELEIKGKVVINCTGAFADELRLKANPNLEKLMVPVQGDHLTFKKNLLQTDIGLINETKDGRVMYCLPWNGVVLGGTTEEHLDKVVTHPVPSQKSVDFILEEMQELFPEQEIEVISKWGGIRPLIRDIKIKETKKISRVHLIEEDKESGLISALGGKWTIFRRMGQQAVDKGLDQLLKRGLISEDEYKKKILKNTDGLSLIGIFKKQIDQNHFETVLPQQYVNLKKYGQRSYEIIEKIQKNQNLGKTLHPNFNVTVAEIEYLIETEMIEMPVDLLVRRLRLSFQDASLAHELLPKIVDIYGNIKGWSQDKKLEEYENNKRALDLMRFN